jgi:hypothetical protein
MVVAFVVKSHGFMILLHFHWHYVSSFVYLVACSFKLWFITYDFLNFIMYSKKKPSISLLWVSPTTHIITSCFNNLVGNHRVTFNVYISFNKWSFELSVLLFQKTLRCLFLLVFQVSPTTCIITIVHISCMFP